LDSNSAKRQSGYGVLFRGPGRSWILQSPELVSFLTNAVHRAGLGDTLPSVHLGKSDPDESRPPGAVRLSRLVDSVSRTGGILWAPPPLLAVLPDAELSLGLAVGGGAEGSVTPPPPPAQVSVWRHSVPPASSNHCHRPSGHHPSLFLWAWFSLAKSRHSPLLLVAA
jgi:hypothetical protein